MEEYRQITLDEWTQWKEDIRRKLAETANNFVYIGYRLKQIRDSGMYDGAADIFEFAQKEYGLGKSTVSRFIAINEKYSEGGNSLELKEEFREFSSSKLAEMLTLPDSEIQLITEKTTIQEIRELKRFNTQEAEELGEAAGSVQEQERTPLEKCMVDFFKVRKEMLNGVMKHMEADPPEYKQAAEMMAPSGQASHKKGIVFLFLYDWNTGIKYKLMTEPEPMAMTWMEFLNIIYHIFGACDQTNVWEAFYGEPEGKQEAGPEEEENHVHNESNQGIEFVATSQQEGEKEPAEKRENSEETKLAQEYQETEESQIEEQKPEEQEAAGVENEKSGKSEAQGEDCEDSTADRESSAGAESEYDEDGTGGGAGADRVGGGADREDKTGVAPVQPDVEVDGKGNFAEAAGVEESGAEETAGYEGLEKHIENQVKIIIEELQTMRVRCVQHNWDSLIERAKNIITRSESLKNMEEVYRNE